ncbi:MAG: DUF1501 domain-containing protein [Planctomycetales bacterium]|nr:DUF1501 domain-containing protein [Planctomycetales bacterium]
MNRFNRRQALAFGLGLTGASVSGWFPTFADRLVADPRRRRHCILLWMTGGPSQTDTFDMKPNHENGGEFKEIATNVPGIRMSEHLPQLANHADQLAIVRGLSTKEGDHGRGTFLMRTGHVPLGPTQWPALGAALSKELGSQEEALPNYVSIAPFRAFNRQAFGPGFLGPKYAPLVVGATDVGQNGPNGSDGFAQLKVDAIQAPAGVTDSQMKNRLEIWRQLQSGFVSRHQNSSVLAHETVYRRSVDLMNSDSAAAFDLSEEPTTVREAYGKGMFGQGCLMARRLIERGASFVEVTLGNSTTGNFGWDTHSNNFEAVKALSTDLDAGWATLMTELKERGLLESTTIMWMGEFGRTPQINGQVGRDHFPQAWTCVLAGGGIAGGQTYGKTSADGMTVEENKVGVENVLATLCEALGVPPETENTDTSGRPLPIVDGASIKQLLA